MSKSRKRYNRFGDLPREFWYINQKPRYKRNTAVKMRWLIKSNIDGLGEFLTNQYIPGTTSYNKEYGPIDLTTPAQTWADFYFMSNRPIKEGIFYNATISTLFSDVASEIIEEATDQINEKVKHREKKFDIRSMFEDIPGSKLKRFVFRKGEAFEELNGLTKKGAIAKWLRDYLDSGLLETREVRVKYKKIKDYRYGVGLNIVTDSNSINLNSILNAIETFRSNNETSFEKIVPIAPHLVAIRAYIKKEIEICEKIDAEDRGIDKIDSIEITEEEKPYYYGSSSIGVKL